MPGSPRNLLERTAIGLLRLLWTNVTMSVSIVKGGETLINTGKVELFLVSILLDENHFLRTGKQKAIVWLTRLDAVEIHTAADLCSVS